MDPLEGDTHSFIVKIWAEPHARSVGWQGHVTHVASGQRRSFRNLRVITAFISSYVQADRTTKWLPGWLKPWKPRSPGIS